MSEDQNQTVQERTQVIDPVLAAREQADAQAKAVAESEQQPADSVVAKDTSVPAPTPTPAQEPKQNPAPKQPAKVIAENKPSVFRKEQPVDKDDPLSIEAVAKALNGVPDAYRAPIVALKDYFKEMAPGKSIDPVRGGILSAQLLRTITNVINRNEEHFNSLFTAILRLFEAHADGALGEAYVFRFVPHMQASDDERRAFTQLVNLIKTLGPVKGRKEAMKQVDLPRSLRYSLTDAGRDRVMNYFNA